MSDRLLPDVPNTQTEEVVNAAPGDEIEIGDFDSLESSSVLVANTFGFFLNRASESPSSITACSTHIGDISMQSLPDVLEKNRAEISQRLFLPSGRWCKIVKRINKLLASLDACEDEQIWTFLAATGYAISGIEGVENFTKILTGSELHQPDDAKIWMEAQPFPTRKSEGNTNLDLALGTITLREKTKAGIELRSCSRPWICFCEMKWYRDISLDVEHDIHRNQLARVIENALFFDDSAGIFDQSEARYSDNVYVALITPKIFREADAKSRLYQYKFDEYEAADHANLLKDLHSSVLEMRNPSANMEQQLERLTCLRWATYDDIFAHMPDSDISSELKRFWEERGSYQGRETST